MSSPYRWKLAEHPAVVLVGLIASLVAIIPFLTGITSLREVILPEEVTVAAEGAVEGTGVGGPVQQEEKEVGTLIDEESSRKLVAGSELESAITQYWSFLNAREFMSAWSALSPSFQERNHGNEYEHYRAGQVSLNVCSVHAEDLGVRSVSDQSGIVSATIVFRAGSSCRMSREQFDFLLVSNGGGRWLIDRVMPR